MRERGRTRRLLGLGARTGGALIRTRMGGQADWRNLVRLGARLDMAERTRQLFSRGHA
ncbi:hypothetical protein [Halomonas sp. 11-S5]|uniref:hypothetical protein n=1 Tax=Halomonas sp. 11-S5 TaxID=2994064 RepID=UPI0024696443|nr:hypothetical protein [Halomonas sp. 11-S5]